jgi:hypothetical protein
MSRGPLAGRGVDQAIHDAIVDAYYDAQGWTAEGNVGDGLLKQLGLDMVTDPERRTPLPKKELQHIISFMAEEGVLVGSTGRDDNVLKIRPLLVFDLDNADQLLTTLDTVLGQYCHAPGVARGIQMSSTCGVHSGRGSWHREC